MMRVIKTVSDVYLSGSQGYYAYRIPALLRMGENGLLAFCEGRKSSVSDHGDIRILVRKSTDNGHTWSAIKTAAAYKTGTAGNPVPFYDEKKRRVVLVYTVNESDAKESMIREGRALREVYVTYSDDHGLTFSKGVNISSSVKKQNMGWFATGPGHGLITRAGLWIAPCNHSRLGEPFSSVSHVIVSRDCGLTWQLSGMSDDETNESCVCELSDGQIYMNMRIWPKSNHACRKWAVSSDQGRTFKKARTDAALPDPCCQASVISCFDNTHHRIFFSNAADTDKRKQLTVRMSLDDAKTWCDSLTIHSGFSAYSDLAVLDSDHIACLYETGTNHRPSYGAISYAIVRTTTK